MLINSRVKSIVYAIKQEFDKRFKNKATLIWFGSWVKGTAVLQSDIDLAINSLEELNQRDFQTFKDYVDDYPTLYKIDLVDMNLVGSALLTEIHNNGKEL